MDTFFSTYVLPGLLILLQSVAMIVILLIFVAYILYADRKIWAAVQRRRGPNVVGPWGLFRASSCWRRSLPRFWRLPHGR